LTIGASPICISDQITFSANSVVLGEWYLSSSNIVVATKHPSTGVVTTKGTSNIIYTITGGCSGTKPPTIDN
jgi:hypothetical protein